ncbi:general secretion pathway protein GspB [Ramlibacter ginsenosidimutans]|uniref:General secretion pathway protein GspB n=1 Tax=Ramlibacter ginsenosidimutans TaxID=502333 RepID=A0A934WM59_9BURK|nr:general secretion pathway protein GspB [Ramlibacter ginsenosidimutans]MBK6007459.1 general secretion pathway protein GspB [Ramlibacter ginsenosidimutans]
MSYILDALRRADAERERDPARGIHAQPGAGAPATARAPIPGWAWPLGALAVVGAALVFAWQRPNAESAAPQVAVAVVPPQPAAPAVTPAPAAPTVVAVADVVSPPAPPMPLKPPVERAKPTVVAAARPHAAAAPAAGASAPPATVPVASSATTAATPAPAAPVAAAAPGTAHAAGAPASAGNGSRPEALATAKLAPASAAPVATASANRVFNPAELPADVQGALPKLAITGGVYSENAAQRMLVVGGQVVNEGAELAPGVVLDQIRSRSAVLRFRGYRYAVSY